MQHKILQLDAIRGVAILLVIMHNQSSIYPSLHLPSRKVLSGLALGLRYSSYAQIRRIAIVVICLSPALRLYLSFRDIDLYTNVFCRLDGLMAGALLALIVRADNFSPSKFIKVAWISLVIAAPLAFATEALNARWIVFSLTAVASASFVYLALFSAQKSLQTALTNRFLVYTGTISYGLYLLHKVPFDVARTFHVDRDPFVAVPIILVACYATAALSWNLLEKPFLKLKRFFESKPGPLDRAKRQFVVAESTQ